jgi:hypothetical protein
MSNESISSGISWEEAFKQIQYVPKIPDIKFDIFVNPEVYNKLMENFPVASNNRYSPYGMKITVDKYIPKHPKKWEFPKCRFVEYEPKDEEWARPLRHGREVDDTSQYIGFAVEARDYLIKTMSMQMSEEIQTLSCSGIITGYRYETLRPFGQIDIAGK